MLFDLSLICSTFWHNNCPPFHTIIRIHLITLSYHILVILPSHFSSTERMLMLMFDLLYAELIPLEALCWSAYDYR